MKSICYHDDVISAARSLNSTIESKIGGVTNYGFVLDRGGKVVPYRHPNTACIAGVSGLAHSSISGKPLLVGYNIKGTTGVPATEDRVRWCKWVTEESVWKDVFVMLDKFNCTEHNFVVARTDINANYMATGLNILRIGIENKPQFDSWNQLVTNGVDKNMAFILCQHLSKVIGDKVVVPKTTTYFNHSILSTNVSRKMLEFLTGRISVEEVYGKHTGNKYEDKRTYYGASKALNKLEDELYSILPDMSNYYNAGAEELHEGIDLLGRPYGTVVGRVFTVKEINDYLGEL